MTTTEPVTEKRCPKCTLTKAAADFPKNKSTKDGLGSWCKLCNTEHQRERYAIKAAELTEAARREMNIARLCKTYGITREKYDDLTRSGACAVCGRTPTFEGRDILYIDHDHACCPREGSCGKCVREACCMNCNLMLGHALDDVDILAAGIEYVQRHREQIKERKAA